MKNTKRNLRQHTNYFGEVITKINENIDLRPFDYEPQPIKHVSSEQILSLTRNDLKMIQQMYNWNNSTFFLMFCENALSIFTTGYFVFT